MASSGGEPGSGGARAGRGASFGVGGAPLGSGGAAYVNDAGIPTYAVPPTSQDCPPHGDVPGNGPSPELVAASCSAEAAQEYGSYYVCFAAPESGASCAGTYDPSCVADYYQGGLVTRATFVCGPLPADRTGQCCYVLTGSYAVGRPFLVAGVSRVAEIEAGPGWAAPMDPDVASLDADTRRALADASYREAATEHASVASFARFALQCLACGAPADIVRGAHQAALDEVAHAEAAFGLANAYAGKALRPGPLHVNGALDGALDVVSLARSVASEGAIAETVSALLIASARDAARDPAVRAVLTRVAEEEMEHVLLAWRALSWAVESGGEAVRAAVEEVFSRAAQYVGFGAVTEIAGSPDAMRAHGYLPVAERRAIAERALRSIVEPAARELLKRGRRGTATELPQAALRRPVGT